MTTTTQTIETKMGVYSTCKYKSKCVDDTFKVISLSAVNKKYMRKSENQQEYQQGPCEMKFESWYFLHQNTQDTNWWSTLVCQNWEFPFYKPIRVLEKIEIMGTPGLGKIISKEKFWLKKVLIRKTEPDVGLISHTHSIYVSFAISQGEKNGVYTLIDEDNCNDYLCDGIEYDWLFDEGIIPGKTETLKDQNDRFVNGWDFKRQQFENKSHKDFCVKHFGKFENAKYIDI
jgi:hypothetical protein